MSDSAPSAPTRRRPRSRHVTTLLVGTALTVTLVACGERETEPKLFSSFDACTAERSEAECREAERQALDQHARAAPRFTSLEACEAQMGPGNCVAAPGEGTGQAQGQAPGQTQAQGQPPAQVAGQGGGWFMPAIAGFLLGRALSGPSVMPVYYDRQGYAYAGGQPYGRLPPREQQRWSAGYYGGYGGSWNRGSSVPGSAAPVGRGPGGIDARPPTPGQPPLATGGSISQRAPAPAPQVNRGGFGSTGRSVGLSGGG